MGQRYTKKKSIYSKKEIKEVEVYFDNGDHLSIRGKELVEFSVRLVPLKFDNPYVPTKVNAFAVFSILRS